jgi:hypothetical protein
MLKLSLSLFVCVAVVTASLVGAAEADDRYLAVVRKAADAILAEGLDTHGPVKSAMILSVLDAKTGKPLEKLPKAPTGVRSGDRSPPFGSNANIQQDLYRTLDELSRITGDDRYRKASHAALIDFLRLAQSPTTGLLAWGEHMSWDCLNDKAAASTPADKLIHEPKRDLLYFDLLYEAEPEKMLKYARGLWDHQIADQKTGDFSRHAAYDKHDPRRGFDFPKEGGYFIDTWARAYEKSKDPVYLTAIQVLAKRFLGRMNDRNLLDFDSSGAEERKNTCIPLWMPALALECTEAAPRVDAETAELLRALAERQDRGFLSLPHDPSTVERGFVYCVYTDSGKLRPRYGTEGYSRHWGMGYGVNTTAMFALQCYAVGDVLHSDGHDELVVDAADLYATVLPDAAATDIWAGEYGMAIFTEIAAFRLTGDKQYLDAAKTLADRALADLWPTGAVLPRASTKTAHYEAIAYSDTLLLSLLALHEHVNGLRPTVPISAICR